MDTPRCWQVASIATAVTSLGIGALLVGRSTTEPVAPIELEIRTAGQPTELDRFTPDPSTLADLVPETPEPVVVLPESLVSAGSVGSPEEPVRPPTAPPATATAPTTTATAPPPPPPKTAAPAAPARPSKPVAPAPASHGSIASVGSLDSDD
jgi:hypothetical protein